MTEVVNLEMKLGESLGKFVELEKKRLQQIKQFADSVKEATNQVKIEGLKSLENPTTTYALIKRFANGWSELGKFLDKDYSNGKCVVILMIAGSLHLFYYALLGFSYVLIICTYFSIFSLFTKIVKRLFRRVEHLQ